MLTSRKRIWLDQIHTVLHYYSRPRFALIDLTYGFCSLFQNPYRTCRKFLEKKKVSDIHAYGETPLATYEKFVRECNIQPTDIWYEMGSGRGKGCFWLAHFARCRVVGIEWIPQFVFLSKLIQTLFRIGSVSFQCTQMERADLSKATVIYLYGNYPPLTLPPQAKVITISEPLEGYQVIKQFWVRYPWGRTAAFLNQLP